MPRRTEILLAAIMLVSLAVFHVTAEYEYAMLGGLAALPLLVPSLYFAFPLSQAFLSGVAAGRDQTGETRAASPWGAFAKVLGGRMLLWIPLWIAYIVVVEMYLELIVAGGNMVVSVSNAALMLGMAGACFIWAPRCRQLWTLSLLAVVTALPAYVLLFILGAIVLDALGYGGYMGLGLVVGTPFVILGCLFVASFVLGFWAWCRGDKWFRAGESV